MNNTNNNPYSISPSDEMLIYQSQDGTITENVLSKSETEWLAIDKY